MNNPSICKMGKKIIEGTDPPVTPSGCDLVTAYQHQFQTYEKGKDSNKAILSNWPPSKFSAYPLSLNIHRTSKSNFFVLLSVLICFFDKLMEAKFHISCTSSQCSRMLHVCLFSLRLLNHKQLVDFSSSLRVGPPMDLTVTVCQTKQNQHGREHRQHVLLLAPVWLLSVIGRVIILTKVEYNVKKRIKSKNQSIKFNRLKDYLTFKTCQHSGCSGCWCLNK